MNKMSLFLMVFLSLSNAYAVNYVKTDKVEKTAFSVISSDQNLSMEQKRGGLKNIRQALSDYKEKLNNEENREVIDQFLMKVDQFKKGEIPDSLRKELAAKELNSPALSQELDSFFLQHSKNRSGYTDWGAIIFNCENFSFTAVIMGMTQMECYGLELPHRVGGPHRPRPKSYYIEGKNYGPGLHLGGQQISLIICPLEMSRGTHVALRAEAALVVGVQTGLIFGSSGACLEIGVEGGVGAAATVGVLKIR